MQPFSDTIRDGIARHAGIAASEVKLEAPRDSALGDLAFPCFVVAKALKMAPAAIAAELAAKFNAESKGITATATGPYVNFKIDRKELARAVIGEIEAQGAKYGSSQIGAGKTIVLDYSSPNIAKPMHVGHIRSTIIGAALQRIFDALGYKTVGINHIGDWGAQFGGLVVAIRRWGETVDLEKEPVHGLLDLYQRSKKAIEDDADFARESKEAYQELESGREGAVRKLWRWITEVSLKGFDKTYARLGIRHDFVRGESFYEDLLEPTIERVQASGVSEISRGALVVRLEAVDEGLAETPCLLRQSNGTTLYATRDLAALFQRFDEFRFERALYVVGAEQKLHFRQLKAVLKRMGIAWEPRIEHIDFGMLLGAGRVKLASRNKGEVLILDDLIDDVIEEAERVVLEKNPHHPNARAVAEQVGIGAIIFNDLKRERIRDVVFDKREILSFEGETGPYVQYTHARLASILRKAAEAGEGAGAPDFAVLEEAGPLLGTLARFPDVVRSAALRAEPSEIATYLLGLGRDVNAWYVQNRVLGQAPGVTAARLALVRASKTVLHNGLRFLGPTAPDEM